MKQDNVSLFTITDYAIVRSAVRKLPGLLGLMVEMRFWHKLTIAEIASELGVSIKSIETALPKALRIIRAECVKHPAFSRTQFEEIQFNRLQNAA